MRQVLLLNSSYEPLNVCSWQRAMGLLIKGKAVAMECLDHHPVGGGYALPLVIRLLYYVKIPHKQIPLTRKNVMHRDMYSCQYCGSTKELTIDHVLPRSRGGRDEWENVVAACLRCNIKKGSKTPKEAGMPLRKPPQRPYYFMQFEMSKQSKIFSRHSARHQDEPSSNMPDSWQKYMFF